jgi:hypothetical protein
MNPMIHTLENMLEAASSMDTSTLALMGYDDLLLKAARAEQAGRVFDAIRVATANEVSKRSDPAFGADGLAASYGARNAVELLERVTQASTATIRRRLRIGAATQPRSSDTGTQLPGLFERVGIALSSGLIGLDAAEAITRELSAASPRAAVDALLAAERILVASASGQPADYEDPGAEDLATDALRASDTGSSDAGFSDTGASDTDTSDTGPSDTGPSDTGASDLYPVEHGPLTSQTPGIPLSADLIRVQARAWRDALDPDGVEPFAEQAAQRRDFWMSRTAKNGLHPFGGAVTPEIAAITLAIMDATLTPRTAPKFLEADEARERGIQADPRTPGQQRADTFAAMVSSFGSSDRFGTPPTVMITTTATPSTVSTANTGQVSGITDPIPGSVVTQFICDGGFQSVILSPNGRIIKLGSKSRFFTKAQRRAIAARDGLTCIVPGCRIPVTACEAHHIKPDHKGGPTHTDNGVMACWYHHRMLDTGTWTITMQNGVPTVHPPTSLTRFTRTAATPMRT